MVRLCLVVLGTSTACAFQMPLGGQRQATLPSNMPQLHLQRLRSPYEATVLRWRGGKAPTMLIPAVEPAVLSSSLQAVTELLTCCGLGVLATRVGLLDAAGAEPRQMVFNIFLRQCSSPPCRVPSQRRELIVVAADAARCTAADWLGLFRHSPCGGPGSKPPRDASGCPVEPATAACCHWSLRTACSVRSRCCSPAPIRSLPCFFWAGLRSLDWATDCSLGNVTGQRRWPSSADDDGYWTGLRKRVLTPPIVGCLSGILVGALPPLRICAARGWRRRTFAASAASMPRGFRQGL